MEMKSSFYVFNDFLLFSNVKRFINTHEYANYENRIICIYDNGMKALNVVPILVVYDK